MKVVNILKSELKQIDANEEKLRRDKEQREEAAKHY